MSLSQKVAFNTLVQIVAKIITVIFGLLTAILLIGYLGREVFGDYTYVITLVVMFGALADWGTATIGVREASKAKENQGRILSNIFMVRLALAAGAVFFMIAFALVFPIRSVDPVRLQQAVILGSLVTFFFALKASFGIIFQTKMVMHKLALVDIVASFLILLFSWWLIQQRAGLLALIIVFILANLLALLIAWTLARKTIKFDFRPDWVFIKKFVNESLPMGLILLVFTIDNKIDTVMLGYFKGSGAVAIYGVAYRVYDVLILGAAYLMAALLPVLSGYSEVKKWQAKLKAIYQKAFDVLILMAGAVMVFSLFFTPLIVQLITQHRLAEFIDSILVLRILSLALFLAYFNHLSGYTIVALGRQRPYLLIAMTALVFNLTANFLVIPRWSYFGAAGVTVLTEGLILLITSTFVYQSIKIVPSLTQWPKVIIQLVKKKGKIF